jgi:hypothetical protein
MNFIRRTIFNFIRRIFWSDYDRNEDFSCGYCGKEMLRRFLYCSQKCTDADEDRMRVK